MRSIWSVYAPNFDYSHNKIGSISYFAKDGDFLSKGQIIATIEVVDELGDDSSVLYSYDVTSPINGNLKCYFTNSHLVKEKSLVASMEGANHAISEEEVFDDWVAFSEKMRPDIDGATFFPQKLLPHPRNVLLKMFVNTYKDILKNNVPSKYIDSVGVNVCNLFKFVQIENEHVTQTQRQINAALIAKENIDLFINEIGKIKEENQELSKLDKKLINSLADNLLKFCDETGYDKERMYLLNIHSLYLKNSSDDISAKFTTPKIKDTSSLKPKEKTEPINDIHQNIYANKSLGGKILIYIGITIAFGFGMGLIKIAIRLINQS